MSRKCTKISFGTINCYIFLILIGAIFRALLSFLESISTSFNEQIKHPVVYSITYSIGLCLNFILLIIFKIRNKSAKEKYGKKGKDKDKDKDRVINNTFHLDNDNKKLYNINILNSVNSFNLTKHISNKEKYLWILLISFVDYIAYFFFCVFWVNIINYLNTWGFTIGFMSIFSYKILKTKLYKHHYLCIIVIIIIGNLFNIIADKFTKKNFLINYPYYLSFLFTEIAFSLVNVMYKYLMHKKYIKSYEILFSQGIIEFIFGVITLIITTKINKLDNFLDFIHSLSNDGKEIAIFIALIIDQFLVYSIQITIIDIFSPFHVFLLNILTEFILFFFMINRYDGNLKVIITTIVSTIICFAMILIFIEIIELNFCGLSYMTKKNIELRAEKDSMIDFKDEEKEKIDYEGYSLTIKDDKINELNDINELFPMENDSIEIK